jgi:hypothetical protein
MDIRLIAKFVGPIVLSRTTLGKRALDMANEVLPEALKIPNELTGDQVLARVKHLPVIYLDELRSMVVAQDDELHDLKLEIKRIYIDDDIPEKKGAIMTLIALILILLFIGIVYVGVYIADISLSEGNLEALDRFIKFFSLS